MSTERACRHLVGSSLNADPTPVSRSGSGGPDAIPFCVPSLDRSRATAFVPYHHDGLQCDHHCEDCSDKNSCAVTDPFLCRLGSHGFRAEYFDFYLCRLRTETSVAPAQSGRVGPLPHDRRNGLRHDDSGSDRLGHVVQLGCAFEEPGVWCPPAASSCASDAQRRNHGCVVRHAGDRNSSRGDCASRRLSLSRSFAFHHGFRLAWYPAYTWTYSTSI